MDFGGLDGLFKGHCGQDRWQPLRQHGLAGAWRPDHQDVMATGGGDLERTLGLFLAADLAEIVNVAAGRVEHLVEID